MGLFRNRSHFAVYILSQFKNVLRIGAAEIVGPGENLHPDSVIAGSFTADALWAIAIRVLLRSGIN